MQCQKCGAENREGSNFCRYCAAPLTASGPTGNSGYIPSVPPPNAQPNAQPNPSANPENYTPPYPVAPYQPPRPASLAHVGHIICPRCGSNNVVKGTTPLWAILTAIIGFFIVCLFSLFFLLVKDPNKCLNCGLEFK